MSGQDALQSLTPHEAATVGAVFERMFPADEHGPGAVAIGAVSYLDRALNGAYADLRETYRLGLAALDRASETIYAARFAVLTADRQDIVLADLEAQRLPGFVAPEQWRFWDLLRAHMQEGVFADPSYGGNRDCAGWRVIGHPGVWLENSSEENLSADPVTKGGRTQSLADVVDALRADTSPDPELPGYDPQTSVEPPSGPVDVVLVGVGAVGGLVAPILSEAGLRVVGLEAGPLRSLADYIPDELGATYYCRQNLGQKFMAEEIRWRRNAGEATRDPGYSLGRMMNGAGGSVIHYGAWLRRFHPHHLSYRSYIVERWGKDVIPEGCTVADWPVTYDELEPYFTRLDREVGVAGDNLNPFLARSEPYPLPPMRPFRMGELFAEATRAMGLHPHAVPVGLNSAPYNGFPETTYTAWNNGFGSWRGDKWHPGLTSIPRALATGNLELRTGCRATRIETDADGRATGVRYVDALGREHTQRAATVILCAYTWENVRLLFLSADGRHSGGLGNATGQLGKHLMVKNFAHVDGRFPDTSSTATPAQPPRVSSSTTT
jgi:gluconate 2-dehydrogenase alpha chain